MGISCDEALLDRVCLLLERGFAAVYLGLGKCSVEVCLVCWPVSVSFHSVDLLVRFAESRGFYWFRADSLFRTFVVAPVVVGRACISKTLTTPCDAGWRMRG